MQHKKVTFSVLLLLVFGLIGLQAQETIPATGGNATGGGGSVSYSLGQIFYTTNIGTNGSVVQGVQQPYEITAITGIAEAEGIRLEFTAYPNPATDFVKLQIEDYGIENLEIQLFDMKGKLYETRKVTAKETIISMDYLVPATYILKVVQTKNASSHQEIKTFKIIKN